MGKLTMAHFAPVKQGSELHNTRGKDLDYVRKDLSHLNAYWQSDTQANVIAKDKVLVKEKTGRAMQAKATPLQEAVVLIDEDTTMEDLQRLGKEMERQFGIHCFQISMHKDEGHWRDGMWIPNLHAHMVYNWILDNGKSFRPNRSTLSRVQDTTAEVLDMQRGKSSDIEHLNAIQYKNRKEEERQRELERSVKAKLNAMANRALDWVLSRPTKSDKELAIYKEQLTNMLADAKRQGAAEVIKEINHCGTIYNTNRNFKTAADVSDHIANLEQRAHDYDAAVTEAEMYRGWWREAESRLEQYEGKQGKEEAKNRARGRSI